MLPNPLQFGGVVCELGTMNKNAWAIDPREADRLISQMNSGRVTLRRDHSDSVDSIIGKIRKAERRGNTIRFLAEVADSDTAAKIRRQYIQSVSLRMRAGSIVCARCNSKNVEHHSEGHYFCQECRADVPIVVSKLDLSEVSLVTDGAFPTAKIDTVYQ
jgi:hypothetical protein